MSTWEGEEYKPTPIEVFDDIPFSCWFVHSCRAYFHAWGNYPNACREVVNDNVWSSWVGFIGVSFILITIPIGFPVFMHYIRKWLLEDSPKHGTLLLSRKLIKRMKINCLLLGENCERVYKE